MVHNVHTVNTIQLPPSSQKILRLLEDGNPRTFKDMVGETDIAPRTIRYALKRLKENGLIVEKFNFRDARQILYQRREFVAVKERGSTAVV